MALNYRIKKDNIIFDLSNYFATGSTGQQSGELLNYRFQGKPIDLSLYSKYDAEFHKYNPLTKLKGYYKDVNKDITESILAKGYKPAGLTSWYLQRNYTESNSSVECYYEYELDNLGMFKSGKLTIGTTTFYSFPLISIEICGSGGTGGAPLTALLDYSPGAGGGAAAYSFIGYDLTWGGTAPVGKKYKVFTITLGECTPRSTAKLGFGGQNGPSGAASSLVLHINNNDYTITVNGGSGGTGGRFWGGENVGKGGTYTIPNNLPTCVWWADGINGTDGKVGDGTTSLTYEKQYDINTYKKYEQTTGNHPNPGGCCALGRGGWGGDGNPIAASGYGSGGGGGIAWFWPNNGRAPSPGAASAAYINFKILGSSNLLLLTFNTNGGTEVNSIMVTRNSKIGLIDETTRTGYTFDNWTLDDGTIITPDTVYIWSVDKTANANWIPNTYTISFDSDGGEVYEDMNVNFDAVYTLPQASKENYIFNFWYYKIDDFIQPMQLNGIYSIANDVQLTAAYKISIENRQLNEIVLNPDGGDIILSYYEPELNDTNIIVQSTEPITIYAEENSNKLYYLDNGVYYQIFYIIVQKDNYEYTGFYFNDEIYIQKNSYILEKNFIKSEDGTILTLTPHWSLNSVQ